MPSTNSGSSNVLLIFGGLVGLAFILVAAVIAVVYSDGANATIVLPILLAQVGPLILLILNLARAIENGGKADTISSQVSQQQQNQLPPATPPSAVVVNVPPTEHHSGPA